MLLQDIFYLQEHFFYNLVVTNNNEIPGITFSDTFNTSGHGTGGEAGC